MFQRRLEAGQIPDITVDGVTRQPESYEELRTHNRVEADNIDQAGPVVEAQERLDTGSPRRQPSEEAQRFERREANIQEFKDTQESRDGLLREFYQTGGDSGTSPGTYMDELRDAQAALFNENKGILGDIDFGDDPPPEDSVNAAMEAYFAVDMEDFTDPNTREKDFEGFFAAKDAALAPLGKHVERVQDFISRNFETEVVTAMRKISDGITDEVDKRGNTYYDREIGSSRIRFREAHPDTDARLFIIGATTAGVLGKKAQIAASELLQQWFGITVRWQDIPKRERTGGPSF